MSITAVFVAFAAVFSLAGWLLPHEVHRLGFRMAAFYMAVAASSAVLTLVRSSGRR